MGAVSGVDGADAVSDDEPMFRVVRGTPTDVELAALSVVLAARTRPTDEQPETPQSPTAWAASARGGRTLPRPGRDAWRLSARH